MSAKNELQKLLVADEMHSKHLENDELTTVRRNLQTQGVDVPYEIVSNLELLLMLAYLQDRFLELIKANIGKVFVFTVVSNSLKIFVPHSSINETVAVRFHYRDPF